MATKIKMYREYILKAKEAAKAEGKKSIIICAKDVHQELSPVIPTLPTCCCAMRSLMLQGDRYITTAETTSGYSIKIEIEYFLHDMETRPMLYPPRKRGRKPLCTRQNLEEWLAENSLSYCKRGAYYHVSTHQGLWLIYVVDSKTEDIEKCLVKLLHKMNKFTCKISLYCSSSASILKKWNSLPAIAKNKLNLTMVVIHSNGAINED